MEKVTNLSKDKSRGKQSRSTPNKKTVARKSILIQINNKKRRERWEGRRQRRGERKGEPTEGGEAGEGEEELLGRPSDLWRS